MSNRPYAFVNQRVILYNKFAFVPPKELDNPLCSLSNWRTSAGMCPRLKPINEEKNKDVRLEFKHEFDRYFPRNCP
jgi:hypothetical protein